MKSFRVQPADAIGGALGDAVGDATGAIADATGAISTAMHAWTPATFSPPLLGLRAERAVDYVGEKASMFLLYELLYNHPPQARVRVAENNDRDHPRHRPRRRGVSP